jgi:hypothetical protein
LKKEDKTIAEKAARFYDLAYEYGANWSRTKEALAALDDLTQDDLVHLMEATIDPEQECSQLVLLFARQEKALFDKTVAIEDIGEWKQTRSFRVPEKI